MEQLQHILKYKFEDWSLLNKALTHGSVNADVLANYERLEFLGDRVLGEAVAHLLFNIFPKEPEGNLSQRFVQLVRKETVAEVAISLNLDKFVKVSNDDLRKIYNKLYSLSENTCACPSLAYVLFYPELVINKVPYFVAGNEPAQMIGLYFNHMAPEMTYSFSENKILNTLINIGRVITFHPPYKRGQMHALMTMKQLAYGDNKIKDMAGYSNQLVHNVCEAIKEVPTIVKPLKRAIRSSSWSGNIPAFVQVDLDEICGGVYEWRKIKDTIMKECGWVPPEEIDKGLHTSCKIEKCKEHSQFVRFYHMRSTMIPFSALEISIASRNNNLSREEALEELKKSLGFSLDEIPECAIMRGYLK